MNETGSFHLLAAAVYLTIGVVYASVTQISLSYLRTRRPPSHFFRIFPLLTGLATLYYLAGVLIELTPTQLEGRASHLHEVLHALAGLAIVGIGPVYRHMIPLVPVRELRPTRRWLAANYLSAVPPGALAVLPLFLATPAAERAAHAASIAVPGYLLAMLLLGAADARQVARRGGWQARANGRSRSASEFRAVWVILGLCAVALLAAAGREDSPGAVIAATAVGLLAIPGFQRWGLERVLERLLLLAALGATGGVVYLALHGIATGIASAELRRLLELGVFLGLAALVWPRESWLRLTIDHAVFGRADRRVELEGFLHALSPDLGTLECSRRALAEIMRVMQIPAAGVILRGDAGTVAHGTFALEPLRRVWPTDSRADALPTHSFGVPEVRDVALKEALIQSDVVAVVPILGPRGRWGHLFLCADVLGRGARDDLAEGLSAFGHQLGLVLDAAELLARAVAVERSLAHAEKLAAIGELAARIAHDIRNPVSAARSLAQQLAKDAGSPFPAEHAAILAELDRVERQVAALLRFSRREEFRFQPLDLGELARSTMEHLRPRLEAAGIDTRLELAGGVGARADREKLRQVIINLVENAMDALAELPAGRRLSITVGNGGGGATLSVYDNGPGVPADALAHLFEPFFSLKEHGTGLGLAIAKRTLDAHGGRITAAHQAGGGMAFRLELPAADA
jgi:signal transduction histidine kinase